MTTAIKELTKKEQLKVAFKSLLKKFAAEMYKYEESGDSEYLDSNDIVDDYNGYLLKEVSIRTDLR